MTPALDPTAPRLPGAMLTGDQFERITGLASTLDHEQALWISGYFAGLSHQARTAIVAPAAGDGVGLQVPDATPPVDLPATRVVTVLYGTETGNARELAGAFQAAAAELGVEAKVSDMADYKPRALRDEQDLVVITATHGEGDPPQTTLDFFEFLEGRKAPKLPDLRFAVLALGDSTYEEFCGAGRRVDERLAELGAQRLADRVDCDVDYEDDAAAWIATLVEQLKPDPMASAASVAPVNGTAGITATTNGAAAPSAFDKRNPFAAELLENQVLTGRGSTKETRHLEISLEGSGLVYQPGDALGIVPQNDPRLVEALLTQVELSADIDVALKAESLPLGEALGSRLEITAATPRFLEHWATLSGADELVALGAEDRRVERSAFLREHHVLDVIERFPVPGIDAEQLVAGLRPLQPRLYSIASSLAAAPDEAHLTVSTVRYDLHGRERLGVASGHLAGLTDDDATVPVYVQANESFRLPDDDAAIVMIGAGTGVAPYRAFLQEREERDAGGRSWLFFGERNFRSDFLYQVEWQAWLKSGALSRIDLAFSRDAAPKTYVQHRLRQQGRDVYAWLEEGAVLYVCGDAAQMAPDVHAALIDIVCEHGGLDHADADAYLSDLKRERRYRLDVY